MDAGERLRALGMLVIGCAIAFELSWLPPLLSLGGASWMSPPLAAALHRLGVAYLVAGPVAHGVALHRAGAEHEAFVQWAARGFAPMAAVAGLTLLFERLLPPGGAFVAGMMVAGLLVAGYGIFLRREGAAAT